VIPWWQPQCGKEELKEVEKVIKSNFLNEGDVTARFEEEFADFCCADYGVAVTNGTSALALSLMAYGIGQGDEVLVPDFTFIATVNAVTLTGAKPVLCDISPFDFNIDPYRLEVTSRTKAIIPVHINGRLANMEVIRKIAKEYNLKIVVDACEAIGCKVEETACFSFAPTKIITTGQGGIIVTNDPELHLRLKELKNQGRPMRGSGGDDVHPSIGFNFRMTNLQAAVGIAQLDKLYKRLARMREIYQIYAELLDLQYDNEWQDRKSVV
jgi:perosamine synthetase